MPTEDIHDPLDDAAESFLARLRRGETPSISEYVARYPELAAEIRDLFPTLAIVERVGERAADGNSATVLDAAPQPKQLGNYDIVREIGRGGMGVVYEAYHRLLGRRVALKVLSGQPGRETKRLLRFQREARAAARLHHTNIVPVHEVGQQEGVHYYSMQFIEGQGLDHVWLEVRRSHNNLAPRTGGPSPTVHSADAALFGDPRRSHHRADSLSAPKDTDRLNTAENDETNSNAQTQVDTTIRGPDRRYYQNIARVIIQVVDALAYAHGEGVLHRDIKPSNVILDGHGRAWVTDFGLAKTDDDQLTESGDIVGTLRYMSPERFTGHADERSDIYSAALTLYEFLTLRPAFCATQRTTLLHQIQHVDPPRPRKIEPTVPRDLETIAFKAINKVPSQRYQTADQFADDLRRFVGDRPIVARRASAVEHGWRWCRRNSAVATLGASVIGLMAALVLVVLLGLARLAVTTRDHADSLAVEKRNVERAERDGRHRLFQAYQNEARARRWSRRPGQRLDSLAAIGRAAALLPTLGLEPDEQRTRRLALRNEAIACLALADLRTTAEIARTPPDVRAITFDNALDRYAWGDKNGKITICRVVDNEQLCQLPGFGARVWRLQFSPDGKFLAAKQNDPPQLCVWNLTLQQPILKTPVPVPGQAFDFCPDSRFVAAGQENQTIHIHELDSGQLTRRLEVGVTPYYMRIDRQGQKLAISTLDGMVQLWNLRTDRELTSLQHPRRVYRIDWSPDGKLLAAGCQDYHVYVWNVETGKQQAVCVGHESEAIRVAFNHKGDVLASATWNKTRLWDPWSGKQLISVSGQATHFGPGDRRLAFVVENLTAGNRLGWWEVSGGSEFRMLHEPPAPGKGPHNLDIHPGGRLMVSTGDDGVRLWDLAQGKEAFQLIGTVGTSTPHSAALFHPSGDSLITSGSSGLIRWPIIIEFESGALKFRIGPPDYLTHEATGEVSVTREALAFVRGTTAELLRLDTSGALTKLKIDADRIGLVALSPNGKWLATGGRRGNVGGVEVWNATTGEWIDDLYPEAYHSPVSFSPSGKWLVAGTPDMFLFWKVASWRMSHEIPRADEESPASDASFVAFTKDESLVAVPDWTQLVRLVDPTTVRHFATLEAPEISTVSRLRFSPDGTKLVIACGSTHSIQLWDLRLIRRELRQINLDWESRGADVSDRGGAPVASHDRDSLLPIVVVLDRGEVSERAIPPGGAN